MDFLSIIFIASACIGYPALLLLMCLVLQALCPSNSHEFPVIEIIVTENYRLAVITITLSEAQNRQENIAWQV